MIENCGTCKIGAETVDEYPGTCPFYKKHLHRHCGNYAPSKKAEKRKLIYVASPLRGNYEKNMAKARQYCKYVANRGHIPYAPHLLFTQFMDDTIPEERAAGIAMGKEMLKRCDELWVFGEVISEGMASEIELAKELGIPIRSISTEEVQYGQD